METEAATVTSTGRTRAVKGTDGNVYVVPDDAGVVDAVFGELTGEGPNYRGLGWIARGSFPVLAIDRRLTFFFFWQRTSVRLVKVQIGLGGPFFLCASSRWLRV